MLRAWSTARPFTVSTLAVGTHTIYFSVKDDDGAWSSEAVTAITVDVPIGEDPTYQQLQGVNETLSNEVDALAAKLDSTTMMLLGTGIVAIVLVVVVIALVYMGRRPKPPATA